MIWGLVFLKDYKAHMHFQMYKYIYILFSKDALNWSKVAENKFFIVKKNLFHINLVRKLSIQRITAQLFKT